MAARIDEDSEADMASEVETETSFDPLQDALDEGPDSDESATAFIKRVQALAAQLDPEDVDSEYPEVE